MKNAGNIAKLCFGVIALGVLLRGGDGSPVSFQNRCGWFSNPTPGNITLHDRDGVWIIASQGAYQTPGDWDWPEFGKNEWIVTNGTDYGYGCVCMKVSVDTKSGHVLEIKSVRPLKISQCRNDKTLVEKWNEKIFR